MASAHALGGGRVKPGHDGSEPGHDAGALPYSSIEDVAARAGVGKLALEGLAGANAFDGGAGKGQGRRQALWAARGAANGLAALPLFAIQAGVSADTHLLPEPVITLPAETEGEAAVADYTALGLSLGRHPLAMLRDRLRALRCDDTRRLNTARAGSWIRLPGLVLMRQRPGSAKGIVFITVEDEFGVGNLVVYTDVSARDRQALVSARLMLAEGRVERETQHAEVPITHLLVRKLIDRSDLLRELLAEEPDWADRSISRADEVRGGEPGARHPGAPSGARRGHAMPSSRDFR